MPRRKTFPNFSLRPLQTEAERRFQYRHEPRHHSDVEFSEAGWRALVFIRWQLGLRTRSQAVNAALVAYAQQLVLRAGAGSAPSASDKPSAD